MARNFTDEDRNKDVYTSEGTRLGRIRDVNEDRATVERSDDDEGLTDKVKDMLGWDDNEESHELRTEHVDSYDDDRIRLRDQP